METNRWSVINVDATDTGFNEKQTGVLRTNVKARANTISIKTTEPNFSMTTSLREMHRTIRLLVWVGKLALHSEGNQPSQMKSFILYGVNRINQMNQYSFMEMNEWPFLVSKTNTMSKIPYIPKVLGEKNKKTTSSLYFQWQMCISGIQIYKISIHYLEKYSKSTSILWCIHARKKEAVARWRLYVIS